MREKYDNQEIENNLKEFRNGNLLFLQNCFLILGTKERDYINDFAAILFDNYNADDLNQLMVLYEELRKYHYWCSNLKSINFNFVEKNVIDSKYYRLFLILSSNHRNGYI